MIKIRIIDNEGKDEVHTVKKFTFIGDRLWFYSELHQYYLPAETVAFMQVWEE